MADLDFVEEKDYYKDADIIIKFGSRRHGDSIAFDGPGKPYNIKPACFKMKSYYYTISFSGKFLLAIYIWSRGNDPLMYAF